MGVVAHRALLSGVDDGDFFSGAFRWPGADESVAMPDGLNQDALMMLLRMRYGAKELHTEGILEMRHFAELFDWRAERERCEAVLETLLQDANAMDSESLLAVVTHSEESAAMPARLKAAALSAAVRHWSRVTDAAESALPKRRCTELGVLNRIRNRDGHVCSSLDEYLHAAEDDLMQWERNLALDAPLSARKQVEHAWSHWHQILFEFGHISGASAAEDWRSKVRMRRDALRDERAQSREAQLPAGRIWFEADFHWREVPQNAICPGGLEFRFDMATGRNYARRTL